MFEILHILSFGKGISNTFLILLLLRYHSVETEDTVCNFIFLLLCSLNVACGLSFKAYFLLV